VYKARQLRFFTDYLNPALKKIIEGLVGIIAFIIFLRLHLVPTYAFIHSRGEHLMVTFLILEAVIYAFIAHKVVRYIHRFL
jgi:hypothetical protein